MRWATCNGAWDSGADGGADGSVAAAGGRSGHVGGIWRSRPKKAAGRVGLAEPAAPAAQAASAAQAEPAKSVRRGAGRRVGGTGGAE